MKTNTNFNITENELEGIMRLVEAQRELAYWLHQYNENAKAKLEELKHITAKAQEIQALRHTFKEKIFSRLTLEEQKKINAMLQAKHIRVF